MQNWFRPSECQLQGKKAWAWCLKILMEALVSSLESRIQIENFSSRKEWHKKLFWKYPCNISKYLIFFFLNVRNKSDFSRWQFFLWKILQKADLKHCITGYSSCKDFTTGGEHAPKREKYYRIFDLHLNIL